MSDKIIRVTAGNGAIRGFFAYTAGTVNRAVQIHKTSPTASAGFGRLITAAAVMGGMLKSDTDLLTLKVKGDGPIGGMVATADYLGRVKGYVNNPFVELPLKPNGKLDVSTAVGMGELVVIRDLGLKEPYVGMIPLVSGEIADDLTYYYATSEQIPTSVALGVKVERDHSIKHAGGFIVQLMPQADEEMISILETNLIACPQVTNMLSNGQDMIETVLKGLNPVINEEMPVLYHCNCSTDRVKKALASINPKEIQEILAEDGKISMHCHFCNKDYDFFPDDFK